MMKAPHQFKEAALEEQEPDLGIIQDVFKFPSPKPDIQWKQHTAGFHHAVICLQQAMTIAAKERHPVARLETGVPQSARQAVGAVGKFRVGEALLSTNHANFFGKLLARISQAT